FRHREPVGNLVGLSVLIFFRRIVRRRSGRDGPARENQEREEPVTFHGAPGEGQGCVPDLIIEESRPRSKRNAWPLLFTCRARNVNKTSYRLNAPSPSRPNLILPGVALVAPRKTKHISLSVCSPNFTNFGGLKGLLGFLSELS